MNNTAKSGNNKMNDTQRSFGHRIDKKFTTVQSKKVSDQRKSVAKSVVN